MQENYYYFCQDISQLLSREKMIDINILSIKSVKMIITLMSLYLFYIKEQTFEMNVDKIVKLLLEHIKLNRIIIEAFIKDFNNIIFKYDSEKNYYRNQKQTSY